MLARIGLALFVIFGAVVIASSLPPRLLDPAWQLRFASSLVNNGTIAIVGFVLVWLAPLFNPASGRLRARRDFVASWAVVAAIGYLLLIPVQVYGAWRGVSGINGAQAQQLKDATAKLVQIRQAVQRAGSTAELQASLQALRAPALAPADLARPIGSVRTQILTGLDTAEATIRQRLGGVPADRMWQLIQESLRVAISSLAYAVAFASGAVWRGQPVSLLDAWRERVRNARLRTEALQTKRGRRGPASNLDYLREISRDESSSKQRSERVTGWEKDDND